MFIELTDHLRCLGDHDEAYLVLLPGSMTGRSVTSGHLGCPVCGWSTEFSGGEVDFGGGQPATGETTLTAEAVAAFLGLSGPGGYVALVGSATPLVQPLAALLPGVRLVTVNPPAGTTADEPASVLRAGQLPLKRSCLRGVVVGADVGADPVWVDAAVRAVLPGLRAVIEGPAREVPGLEVLASGGGVWVGQRGK